LYRRRAAARSPLAANMTVVVSMKVSDLNSLPKRLRPARRVLGSEVQVAQQVHGVERQTSSQHTIMVSLTQKRVARQPCTLHRMAVYSSSPPQIFVAYPVTDEHAALVMMATMLRQQVSEQ
jgi:hypothetical protein